MALDTLQRLLIFLLLVLAQVLVLGHIELFHCATPLLYVYFAIMFPRGYPKWAALLWSFALGLTVDVFNNTPGVSAAAMTLVGCLQPYLLELFLPREAEPDIRSSAAALGFGNFFMLAFLLTLLFCLTFFMLQAFRLFEWQQLLTHVGGSTLLTLILIITLESTRK